MMWAISPVLQERVPHVLHNFRKTATKNDYLLPQTMEPDI